jgi:hypothetical protein
MNRDRSPSSGFAPDIRRGAHRSRDRDAELRCGVAQPRSTLEGIAKHRPIDLAIDLVEALDRADLAARTRMLELGSSRSL